MVSVHSTTNGISVLASCRMPSGHPRARKAQVGVTGWAWAWVDRRVIQKRTPAGTEYDEPCTVAASPHRPMCAAAQRLRRVPTSLTSRPFDGLVGTEPPADPARPTAAIRRRNRRDEFAWRKTPGMRAILPKCRSHTRPTAPAQSRGIPCRAGCDRRVPAAQVGANGLSAHQGVVGLSEASYRRAIRL